MSLGTIALGCVFYCIGFLIRGSGNASDVTMDLTSLVQKAFEHYDSGRFEASIQLLTKADRISPNQPDILELLAMTHLEANRPERALHFYERKLSLLSLGDTNDIATTFYSLGVVYTKLNQPTKAAAYYKDSLRYDEHNSNAHCNLGIVLAEEEAKSSLRTALLLNPKDDYAAHELLLIEKQEGEENLIRELEEKSERDNLTIFSGFGQIDRRTGLLANDFNQEYVMQSRPLILTDIASKMVPQMWNYDYVLDHCRHKKVTLNKRIRDKRLWADLAPSRETTVGQFIEDLLADKASEHYLHDYSLPLNCPALLEGLRIPGYFARDILQRVPNFFQGQPLLYRNMWPSLFLGPKGTMSGLHIDSLCTNFWMALFKGRKKWTFYEKEAIHYLYYDWTKSAFKTDPLRPNFESFPLSRYAQKTEVILEPGEVIFVPAKVPHLVVNLEDTIAISANYVDQSNYQCTCDDLEVSGKRQKEKELLRSVLCSDTFKNNLFEPEGLTVVRESADYVNWEEYKSPK